MMYVARMVDGDEKTIIGIFKTRKNAADAIYSVLIGNKIFDWRDYKTIADALDKNSNKYEIEMVENLILNID